MIPTRASRQEALGLAFLLLMVIPGCDLDFTAPYPEDGPLLSLTLSIQDHGDETHAHVLGQLHPGRDVTGVRRTVEAEELEVLGRILPPVEVASDGTHHYADEWTLPTGAAWNPGSLSSPLSLVPPQIHEVAVNPSRLEFGTCRAAGPASGASPRLRLPSPPRDGAASSPSTTPDPFDLVMQVICDHQIRTPAHSGWSLRLRRAETGGTLLYLDANTPAPSRLSVPGSWLSEEEGEVEVILTLEDHFSWTTSPPGYRTALTVRWIYHWRLGEGMDRDAWGIPSGSPG